VFAPKKVPRFLFLEEHVPLCVERKNMVGEQVVDGCFLVGILGKGWFCGF
jgi:hypothetical protein